MIAWEIFGMPVKKKGRDVKWDDIIQLAVWYALEADRVYDNRPA